MALIRILRFRPALLACALVCAAGLARADFTPTTGQAEYTTPANWTGAINGQFTTAGTNGLTVTFNQDWVQSNNGTTTAESGLLFNYGSGTVTLLSDSVTPRLLTLNGNITTGTSTTGNVVVIGDSTNVLNVDLGGANRTVNVAGGNTVSIVGTVSGPTFGIVKTGAGTLVMTGNSNVTGGYGGDVTALTINVGTASISTINALGQAPTGATVNSLIINGGATFQYTGATASLGGTRNVAIGPGNATFDITPAGTTLTVSGLISDNTGGSGRLVKTGAGTLQLNTSANTYTGGVTVLAGTLGISSDVRLGLVPASNTPGYLVLNAGTTFRSTSTTTLTTSATRGIAIGPTSGSGSVSFEEADPSLLTIDGVITNNGAGTGQLIKNGTGALRLTGGVNDTGANTFSGGIIVNAGILRLRAVGAAGTGPGGIGNGLITLQGTAPVLETAISGSRTYTADVAVTVDASILSGRNGGGAGVVGTLGNLSIGANALTIGTGLNVNADNSAYGITIGGTTTLTDSPTFTVNNNGTGIGTLILGGVVSGNFGMTKSGPGLLTINAANTFTGGVTVGAGALRLRNAAAVGTGAGGTGNGLITLQGSAPVLEPAVSGNTTYTADVAVTADATVLSGRNSAGSGNTQTLGALSIGANAVTVGPGINVNIDTNFGIAFGGTTTLTGTPTFTVNNNGAGTGTLTLGGIVSGNFGLSKAGPGTMTLNAANTYVGPTTISAGTLTLGATASLASSGVTVGTGATFNVSALAGGFTVGSGKSLGGPGTIVGSVTVAGTLAPGSSIGTLVVPSGTMTWNPGGQYAFEHDVSASAPVAPVGGTTADFVNGAGATLSLANLGTVAGSQFQIALTPVTGFASATTSPVTYTLGTFTTITPPPGIVSNDLTPFFSFTGGFHSTPTAAISGNSVTVTFTPVPEPAHVLFACGSLAGLAGWWRRYRHARQ